MKCTIGIDFGTQSARAVLVSVETGEVLRRVVAEYAHPLTDDCLVDGADYDDALLRLMQGIAEDVNSCDIVGVGVDATSLTLVPIAKDGRLVSEITDAPMGRVKLWKRHDADAYARHALELAREYGEDFFEYSGNTVSSEWAIPKILETKLEAPDVYALTDMTLDLSDYLVYRLTGNITRSATTFSYKCHWVKGKGFPGDDYMNALAPGFAAEYAHLMRGDIMVPGDCAGMLTGKWRDILGAKGDVAVAAGQPDGNTPPVGLGAVRDGDVTVVLGTSSVLMLQSGNECTHEGLVGIAPDGAVPGRMCLECSSNCAGDMLNWFVENMATEKDAAEAREKGISIHELMTSRIRQPWSNRLIALDWWNGSRCLPNDMHMAGTLIGMRLETRSEDVYLALMQSMATDMRAMLELCCKNGGEARMIRAGGGMVKKNPTLMQQFADIFGRTIYATTNEEAGALGSAILGAVAAGEYSSCEAACDSMAVSGYVRYDPDMEHREEYEKLYERCNKARQTVAKLQQELWDM